MKTNAFSIVGLFMIVLFLSSCSTSKLLPTEVSNNAKTIKNPENKALVFIYRRSALGAAIGLKVDCNNIELAKFYPKKFYLCVLEPGKYVFTGHGENKDDIIANVEQDKKYYIEVIPQMGFAIARCKLELVDPVKGADNIQKCKLIGANPEAEKALNYNKEM